jgi:alpha-L-rhamnosidase
MRNFRAEFGILGAKWVPRVLADYGYINEAYNLFVQEELPGWGYWVKAGETTLCECWNLRHSHNHIMFGDLSAWMYEYLGGVKPLDAAPGFERFGYMPQIPEELDGFSMSYNSASGTVCSEWKKLPDGRVNITLTVPQGSCAEVHLPGFEGSYTAGKYSFCI